MCQKQFKIEAKELGVDWADVRDTFEQLRSMQYQERQYDWEIREAVWRRYSSKGSHPFWRHGMHVRFPKAFAEGDRTMIPGFDVVAADMARAFPSLAKEGDPAEALFELIARPHNKLPSFEETYREAIDLILSQMGDRDPIVLADEIDLAEVPF